MGLFRMSTWNGDHMCKGGCTPPIVHKPQPRQERAEPKAAIQRAPSPNPNPVNFSIRQVEQVGEYLIARVNYPDATTFEGNKILVFKGINAAWLTSQRAVDPHFHECWPLVARFQPTELGWELAVRLARA